MDIKNFILWSHYRLLSDNLFTLIIVLVERDSIPQTSKCVLFFKTYGPLTELMYAYLFTICFKYLYTLVCSFLSTSDLKACHFL